MSDSQTLKKIVLTIFPMGFVFKQELLNRSQQLKQYRLWGEGGGVLMGLFSGWFQHNRFVREFGCLIPSLQSVYQLIK